MPTCAALSDRYLINHAQLNPDVQSSVGVASRLVLAKYSRWGCHHNVRDCQTLSNLFGLGLDAKTGKLVSSTNVPQWAKEIFTFRQCGTNPIAGSVPGAVPAPATVVGTLSRTSQPLHLTIAAAASLGALSRPNILR
jgi:hypothetical protein